jgi:hypothetical protein
VIHIINHRNEDIETEFLLPFIAPDMCRVKTRGATMPKKIINLNGVLIGDDIHLNVLKDHEQP